MTTRHALAIVLVLGALLALSGQLPVQLSYATSDSMEPTIGVGDGYLVHSLGDVGEGDVVTFWSPPRDEYVTHRIVDVTPGGYATRGDANAATDQASGHPYVRDADVDGEVLSVGGSPLVVPHLGPAVQTFDRHRTVVLAGLVLYLSLALVRSRDRGGRARPVTVGRVMHALFAVLVVLTAGAFAFSGATQESTYVVTSVGVDAGRVLPLGEATTRTVSFAVGPPSPFVEYVATAEGASITSVHRDGGELALTLALTARDVRGPYTATTRVVGYPAVLPPGVLARLQTVHPLAAALPMTTLPFVPLYLLYLLFVDGKRPVRSAVERWARGEGGAP